MTQPRRTEEKLRDLFAQRDARISVPPLGEIWQRAEAQVQRRKIVRHGLWRPFAAIGTAVAVAILAWTHIPTGKEESLGKEAGQIAPVRQVFSQDFEKLSDFADAWNDSLGLGLTEPATTTYAILDLGSSGYGLSDLEMDGPTDFLLDWEIPIWTDDKRRTL